MVFLDKALQKMQMLHSKILSAQNPVSIVDLFPTIGGQCYIAIYFQ